MAVSWSSHVHNRRGVDFTCWGCPDYAEPATPSTPVKVTGISVDPSDTGPVGLALYDPETDSYVVPNGEQSDLYAQ